MNGTTHETRHQERKARRRPDSELAMLLRARRTELGLSQRDVARRSGIAQGMVGEFERGEPVMRMATLLSFTMALDLDPSYLAGVAMRTAIEFIREEPERHHKATTKPVVLPEPMRKRTPKEPRPNQVKPAPLRATPEYGKPGHWLVWSPGQDGDCTQTTVDHCTCDTFRLDGWCACIDLVCELESKEVAA